jgi:hypothetical protein
VVPSASTTKSWTPKLVRVFDNGKHKMVVMILPSHDDDDGPSAGGDEKPAKPVEKAHHVEPENPPRELLGAPDGQISSTCSRSASLANASGSPQETPTKVSLTPGSATPNTDQVEQRRFSRESGDENVESLTKSSSDVTSPSVECAEKATSPMQTSRWELICQFVVL